MKAEYIWFHVIAIIVFILIMALCGVNIYYFNQIRRNPTTNVSSTAAITMIVLNAVAIGLSLIVLIWAIARLITSTASVTVTVI